MRDTHLSRVNSENGDSSFGAGRRELNLPVDTPRSKEGRVEDIWEV
jgi:hypothetical protein